MTGHSLASRRKAGEARGEGVARDFPRLEYWEIRPKLKTSSVPAVQLELLLQNTTCNHVRDGTLTNDF